MVTLLEVLGFILLLLIVWRMFYWAKVGKYWDRRCHMCLVQYKSWDGFVTIGNHHMCPECSTPEAIRERVPGWRAK